MLTFSEYKSPYRLKTEWKEIFLQGTMCPFSSYEYNVICYNTFYMRKKNWRFAFRFLCFKNDNQKAIWALLLDSKKRVMYNVSHDSPMDYFDIVTNTRSLEFHKDCFDKIIQLYPDYSICFENIKEDGVLREVLSKDMMSEQPCAHITVSSYDCWFKGLSKRQRQNIRTAYNRLERDQVHVRLEKYNKERGNPSRITWLKCLMMYQKRCITKVYRNGGTVPRLTRISWYKNMLFSANAISLLRMPTRLVYILFVEDVPVAYLGGFHDKDAGIYYVSRLACSNDWLKYDMGVLLLDKVIHDLGSLVLDLTRGDEPYKLAMGGTLHYNYLYKDSL